MDLAIKTAVKMINGFEDRDATTLGDIVTVCSNNVRLNVKMMVSSIVSFGIGQVTVPKIPAFDKAFYHRMACKMLRPANVPLLCAVFPV